MTSVSGDDAALPRALELLWQQDDSPRRATGLSRERIVGAAIEIADADGLSALSMARLADRLGCGTMSLYRHVANKDDLLTFMLSAAPAPPPAPVEADWRRSLDSWAGGLWDVYHRHPWILQAVSGPPADPGQLAWLDAGLAALDGTGLLERDKLAAVTAVLHYVRGAAALAIEARDEFGGRYSALLKRLIEPTRFPALAATLAAGVFDRADGDVVTDFHVGLNQLLDGIEVRVTATRG